MSLVIIVILAVALLQAYISFANSGSADKTFSGYDPLKLDSNSLRGLLTSDSVYQWVIKLLTFNPKGSLQTDENIISGPDEFLEGPESSVPLKFKFAVLADSHKDLASLEKALMKAAEEGVKFVVMMGDLSDTGTVEELEATKQVLENSGLTYYPMPGDHDLWDSRDKENDPAKNFVLLFKETYQSISYDNVRLILIYNSDNYLGLDGVQLKWIEDELERVSAAAPELLFVFAPTPLFHPSSDHVMGKVNPKLSSQAEHLMTTFKRFGVDLVFSADTHFFLKYREPKNELDMITVGAVTSQKNPQAPRFAIIDILEDGSYNIEETEIK